MSTVSPTNCAYVRVSLIEHLAYAQVIDSLSDIVQAEEEGAGSNGHLVLRDVLSPIGSLAARLAADRQVDLVMSIC